MWKLAWSCLVSDWDACNIDLMIIVKLPFQFKKNKKSQYYKWKQEIQQKQRKMTQRRKNKCINKNS